MLKILSNGYLAGIIGVVVAHVIADYIAGPSHVMPTDGSAKFASSLSVRQFLKYIPIVNIKEDDLSELSDFSTTTAAAPSPNNAALSG